MSRGRSVDLRSIAALQAVVFVAALAVALTRHPSVRVSPPPHASADIAAAHFLGEYVTHDGRVVRRDQGGDIVSEGEAYAMVLAEIAGRPDVVRAVWSWTRSHMQRSDGLLSYHATASGRVLDPQSAADADALAAYALLRYHGDAAASLNHDGRRLAAAVLAHETVMRGGACWVVAAGPWATTPPATVDPSYLMPPVFRAIAKATGVGCWEQLADSSVRLVAELTDGGALLPPDWTRVEGDRLVAIAAPGGGASVRYGPDAARTPVWFAADTSPAATALAVRWRQLVQGPVHVAALTLALDGSIIDRARTPLSLVASAAMARAAGEVGACRQLVRAAVAQADAVPTYYGDAWAALGDALLTGKWHIT